MFMWGPAPIRRTLKYLRAGKFLVRDPIRIMEVHYHLVGDRRLPKEERKKDCHQGMREFYMWEMPRIQHKNPQLQIVRFLDRMPTPFIRFWLDDGSDITIDCFNQDRHTILERVIKTAGKTEERIDAEKTVRSEGQAGVNPAIFGYRCERFCGCEVPGQHPCPGVIRNPRFDQLEVDIGDGKLV